MTLNRRGLLGAGMGAAALATGLPIHPARAAQPISGTQAPGFYRYKVGDIEVTAINDGAVMRPAETAALNATPEQIRKALADSFLPQDRLTVSFTSTVLNTGSRLILIDTGNGNSGAPTTGTWMSNFRAAGFDPANVDLVIISHFHGDHINGLRLKDGTAVFPKAEVIVPAAEWAFWSDDTNASKISEIQKPTFPNMRRVFGPIEKDAARYEWDKELTSGITAVAAPGHTPGHTAFIVSSGNGRLLILSDTANHPALFARNPDWVLAFDVIPDQARDTRRRLLDMAAAERMQVAFYHAPFPATGHVAKDGAGFVFVPVGWQPAL